MILTENSHITDHFMKRLHRRMCDHHGEYQTTKFCQAWLQIWLESSCMTCTFVWNKVCTPNITGDSEMS